ncbi:hypothetical protein [Bradyrhizobium sp. STM 3809]|uniref:hypothetical protein n=1 Tax=Bradyrhizobium sp. STM 3809 TaxID=551936 RepID=UPI0002406AE0|nr:hypothetical protein [Bradyrhizobium sp. STM 3809]CCD97647.1 hypothetical protein BRAS3809_1160030 [Bradyrhizobium sp. STM 3809]
MSDNSRKGSSDTPEAENPERLATDEASVGNHNVVEPEAFSKVRDAIRLDQAIRDAKVFQQAEREIAGFYETMLEENSELEEENQRLQKKLTEIESDLNKKLMKAETDLSSTRAGYRLKNRRVLRFSRTLNYILAAITVGLLADRIALNFGTRIWDLAIRLLQG